ncbi:MAG TPA: methyltransferase domain-containing protein [Candidatus Polarisedimenticolia bacterium]|nr:methyltransferase domain-containing protein [Candidatus Polarisedimenticolia bacterium]
MTTTTFERVAPGLPRTRTAGLKLHLGCFDCIVPGWINTDITPHIWLARVPMAPALAHALGLMSGERYDAHRRGVFRQVQYLDVRRRFPFADGSVEAVFSSHFLEHLFLEDAGRCISEIHRVLVPGGVCRFAVPDLDRMVREYDPADPDVFLHRVFEVSDRRSIKNVHHWHYNESSLTRLLIATGFREAYRCAYRQGRCPDVELLDNRPDESLFVEAVK